MKKTPKSSPIKKFMLCFVAVLMCLSLAGGAFVLFDLVLPETEQSEKDPDSTKKDWEAAGQDVPYLDGAGTKSNPWQISSAEDWAFFGNTMKALKVEDVEDSAMAVAQALSGEDIEMVVASAKARAAGEISATAFSLEDEKPATATISVKKPSWQVSALSEIEQQNPENLFEEHQSVVRANWEVYASADYVNNFELDANIDLSEYRWLPIANMTGNFNGNGHTINVGERTFTEKDIQDPSISSDGNVCIGLFATAGGNVEALSVEGSFAHNSNSDKDKVGELYYAIGSIAGSFEISSDSIIENCICDCQISGKMDLHIYCGGIVGRFAPHNSKFLTLEFRRCVARGSIGVGTTGTNHAYVGGILGGQDTNGICNIYGCVNYANLSLSDIKNATDYLCVGGLIGYTANVGVDIGHSANFGDLNNRTTVSWTAFGGIIGSAGSEEVKLAYCSSYGDLPKGGDNDVVNAFVAKKSYDVPLVSCFAQTNIAPDNECVMLGADGSYPNFDGNGIDWGGRVVSKKLLIPVRITFFDGVAPSSSINDRYVLLGMENCIIRITSFTTLKYKKGDDEYQYNNNADASKKAVSVYVTQDNSDLSIVWGNSEQDVLDAGYNGPDLIINFGNRFPRRQYHELGTDKYQDGEITIQIKCDAIEKVIKSTTVKEINGMLTKGNTTSDGYYLFDYKNDKDLSDIGECRITNNGEDVIVGDTVAENDEITMTATPKLGYVFWGIFGFASAKATNNGVTFNSSPSSSSSLLTNSSDVKDVNNVKRFGEFTGTITVDKNNYEQFQYIYVCFKEVTYKVTLDYYDDVNNKSTSVGTFYFQKTAGVPVNGNNTTTSLNLYDNLPSKLNGQRITATVWENGTNGKQYLGSGDGTLKMFENLSQKTYTALSGALGTNSNALDAAFMVTYDDIVGSGKFIKDISISSFTIKLTAANNDSPKVKLSTQNFCNYWDDLNSNKQANDGGTINVALNGITGSELLVLGAGNVTIAPRSATGEAKPNAGYALDMVERKFSWGNFAQLQGTLSDTLNLEDFYGHLASNETLANKILDAVESGEGIFDKLIKLKGSEDDGLYQTFVDIITVQYQGYFGLKQYSFQGNITGSGEVTMSTFENNTEHEVEDFTASQNVYYNAPNVLKATPNENYRFMGWYLGSTQSADKLLSTDPEFHFVWDATTHGELGNDTLQITAVFDSLANSSGNTYNELSNGWYVIEKPEDIVWLSYAVSHDMMAEDNKPVSEHMFRLTKDIDMADLKEAFFEPIGTAEHPFKGVFDGNFKQIKNFRTFANASGDTLSDNLLSGRGLFGYTDGATIKNLTLEDVNAAGYGDVGFVVGNAKNTNFSRVEVASGNMTATKISFVDVYGSDREANFDRLNFDPDTTVKVEEHKAVFLTPTAFAARVNFGGLVGKAEGCSFVGCSNRGTLDDSIVSNGGDFVAGLVGKAENASIDQCFNMAHVQNYSDKTTNALANLDGEENSIANCYFGDIALSSLSNLSDKTSGVVGLKVAENADYSDIWGILSGKLVLKIFYWM